MRKVFLSVLTTIVLTFSLSVVSPHLKAQYIEPEIYKTTLDVVDNYSASASIELQLRNTTTDKFMEAYEFSIPIKNPQNISVFLDSQPVTFTTPTVSTYTDLKIDFGNNAIAPSAIKTLKINFYVEKVLAERSSVKQLYIPRLFSEATLSNTKYTVTFPASFGDPVFVDLSNTNTVDLGNGRKKFETNTSNGLLVVWGSDYSFDVESKFTINNDSDSVKYTLFNIIPKLPTQEVTYSSVSGGDYGLYDSYGNDFAYTQIDPHSSKEVGFQARVSIKESDPLFRYPDNYSLVFNQDSGIAKKLAVKVTDSTENFVKLRTLNDILALNVHPSKNERINLDLLKDIWERADSTSNLNSFEYCSIIVSYAESLGLHGKIDYGYILVPENINLDISLPHVWCEVSVNDNSVMFDPLLEALTGVQYFNRKPNDRIQFGTWHPSQKYNNALGLLGNSEGLVKLTFTNLSEMDTTASTDKLKVDFKLPTNGFSGEFFDGFLNIQNNTSKVLRITDIALNGDTQLDKLIYNENLTKSVLPKTENKISLSNLREPNFLFDAKKDYNVTLNFDDADVYELKTDGSITLAPDTRVLLFVLMIVLSAMFLSVLMIFRLKRREKFITYH
ncbi:MAG: hypothetical protein ACMG57_01480 [Candidatus Dojkabacteria bacterium]